MMLRFTVPMIGALAMATSAVAQSSDTDTATKEYDSGAVYQGQFKDGKQHGQGTYTAPDGYQYTGEWIEGVIPGKGKAKFPNGSEYTGDFKEGVPDGQGKIVYANGGSYEGAWPCPCPG